MNTEPHPMEKHVPTFMLWGGGFFLLLGIVWFERATASYLKASASKDWPTADATITTSTIEQTTTRVKYQGTKPFYKPQIRYTYAVNGQTYAGDRIATSYPSGSIDESWATAIVSRYPVNRTVKVYYDPNEQSYAVLESGLSSDNIFFFILSSGITVFGIGIMIAGKILRKKQLAQSNVNYS